MPLRTCVLGKELDTSVGTHSPKRKDEVTARNQSSGTLAVLKDGDLKVKIRSRRGARAWDVVFLREAENCEN